MQCNPQAQQVVVGIAAVLVGCGVASFSVYLACHNHNWIHLITAVGAVVFVAGVVGQRAYGPTQDPAMWAFCPAASPDHPGVWAASLTLPALGLAVSTVALAGLFIAVIGICGVLIFEPVRGADDGSAALPERFEDADTV